MVDLVKLSANTESIVPTKYIYTSLIYNKKDFICHVIVHHSKNAQMALLLRKEKCKQMMSISTFSNN